MLSKMDSELWDMWKICGPNPTTPSSGCYKAPTDFGPQRVQEFSSDENMSIAAMVDFGINAS